MVQIQMKLNRAFKISSPKGHDGAARRNFKKEVVQTAIKALKRKASILFSLWCNFSNFALVRQSLNVYRNGNADATTTHFDKKSALVRASPFTNSLACIQTYMTIRSVNSAVSSQRQLVLLVSQMVKSCFQHGKRAGSFPLVRLVVLYARMSCEVAQFLQHKTARER